MASDNPLLGDYSIPPYDRIKPAHFLPALDKALEKAEKKFAAIKADAPPASFHNTVVPLDTLFSDIDQIGSIFSTCHNSRKSDEMEKISVALSTRIAAFAKKCFQDEQLGARFQSIPMPADAEDKVLLHKFAYRFKTEGAFKNDGSRLSAAGRKSLNRLDDRLIKLCAAFEGNLAKGAVRQAVPITDMQELKGLSDSMLSAFRKDAEEAGKEGWLIIPKRLQVESLLEMARSRDLRQRVFEALNRIGAEEPCDNAPLVKEILALRHQRAQLLGYPDYAAYALEPTMAGNLARAQDLMDKVAKAALPKFERTVREVCEYAGRHGGPHTLEPYDLPYWSSLCREEKYGYDARKLSEYLPLENVIKGFFETASRTFGVTFSENRSYPRLDSSVQTYDVHDSRTHSFIGILYADIYARAEKTDGAWMDNLQAKSTDRPRIVSLNMNLPRPAPGKPAFLSIEEAETLFHEGGHTMHGLLGTKTRYACLQGTSGSSDYTEIHSNLMENWVHDPQGLKSFARNPAGEPVPDKLLAAFIESGTFAAERQKLLIIQNARRDFLAHSQEPAPNQSASDIEKAADFDHPLAEHIRSYPLTRFSHLFSDPLSGYAAGYYGYLWSEAHALTAFKTLNEEGLSSPQIAPRMAAFYGAGSSQEYNRCYEALNGGPSTPQALLESIGITAGERD